MTSFKKTIPIKSSYILRRPQKFCEISTFFWLVLVPVKKRWRFRKNFVAISEYMNLNNMQRKLLWTIFLCQIKLTEGVLYVFCQNNSFSCFKLKSQKMRFFSNVSYLFFSHSWSEQFYKQNNISKKAEPSWHDFRFK